MQKSHAQWQLCHPQEAQDRQKFGAARMKCSTQRVRRPSRLELEDEYKRFYEDCDVNGYLQKEFLGRSQAFPMWVALSRILQPLICLPMSKAYAGPGRRPLQACVCVGLSANP